MDNRDIFEEKKRHETQTCNGRPLDKIKLEARPRIFFSFFSAPLKSIQETLTTNPTASFVLSLSKKKKNQPTRVTKSRGYFLT